MKTIIHPPLYVLAGLSFPIFHQYLDYVFLKKDYFHYPILLFASSRVILVNCLLWFICSLQICCTENVRKLKTVKCNHYHYRYNKSAYYSYKVFSACTHSHLHIFSILFRSICYYLSHWMNFAFFWQLSFLYASVIISSFVLHPPQTIFHFLRQILLDFRWKYFGEKRDHHFIRKRLTVVEKLWL